MKKSVHGIIPKDFGLRLKTARVAKELKQQDIAQRCGVHINTYSKYERGKQLPDLLFVQKICDILKVNLMWLLTGENENFENQKTIYTAEKNGKYCLSTRIDTDLLYKIIRSVETDIAERNLNISIRKKSQIIVLMYKELIEIDWEKFNNNLNDFIDNDSRMKDFLDLAS